MALAEEGRIAKPPKLMASSSLSNSMMAQSVFLGAELTEKKKTIEIKKADDPIKFCSN